MHYDQPSQRRQRESGAALFLKGQLLHPSPQDKGLGAWSIPSGSARGPSTSNFLAEQQTFLDLLQGKVEGQELGRLAKNPETGEKERFHRPATDVTFSAPVSLMTEVYGRREVREAHETAVKKALGYMPSGRYPPD